MPPNGQGVTDGGGVPAGRCLARLLLWTPRPSMISVPRCRENEGKIYSNGEASSLRIKSVGKENIIFRADKDPQVSVLRNDEYQ